MEGAGTGGLARERRAGVELLTLDREARMNAFDGALIDALDAALQECADDPAVRAVVITGRGTRAFCAGADLKQSSAMTDAEVRAFLAGMRRAFDRVDRFPRPVIAAINGSPWAVASSSRSRATCA